MKRGFFGYISVTAATTAATTTTASAVAKEEEHEADSDDNPNVFTIEKVTQAVHKEPPFRERVFALP